MQFIIDRTTLHSLVQKVVPATQAAGSMPIFSCIRIEARDGVLSLSASDGRVTIKATETCETPENGALGVNGKAVAEILSNFPKGKLTAKLEGNRLRLKNAKAAVHLSTVPEEHFATIPDYNIEYYECAGFFDAVKKVDFATVADDNSRAWMSGIRISDGRIAATDGHRLALIAFQHGLLPITVPADLLRRAQKAVGDKAAIAFAENRLHFKGDNVFASVSILEGHYPEYQRIIPQTEYQEVKINGKELSEALDLIKATADQRELTVTMDFADGTMKLHSKSEGAEGTHEVSATSEKPGRVSVSIKYIVDVIDRLSNKEEVVLEHRGELTPVVIKENGYVNVIMPKRSA